MAVSHFTSIPAALIAGVAGLVTLARSLSETPRSHDEAATPSPENSVMACGSLATPVAAGKRVRCLLSARSGPDLPGNEASDLQQIEREGLVVELQPTRGRYGYQDVTVVFDKADLPLRPALDWAVENIA